MAGAHRNLQRGLAAHPSHAVALSLLAKDEIITIDSDGKMLAPAIAVVDGAPGTQELAYAVADRLRSANECGNCTLARYIYRRKGSGSGVSVYLSCGTLLQSVTVHKILPANLENSSSG